MMFLVRSTFWLGIVVSNMPLDGAPAPTIADRGGSAVADTARAVTAVCAQKSAACRAILAAATAGLAAGADGAGHRPSANSLDAADLAPPWRGPPAKFRG